MGRGKRREEGKGNVKAREEINSKRNVRQREMIKEKGREEALREKTKRAEKGGKIRKEMRFKR